MILSLDITLPRATFTLRAAFSAAPGVTAVFGPSGAGKSSLINVLAGIETPTEGVVKLGDHTLFDSARGLNLAPAKRRMGYVFQDGRLFPHMTARENLVFSKPYRGRGIRRFDEVVDILGVGDLLNRRPADLSGGERQRIAIGRALLSSPQCLLMDEPLASLDEARKQEILPYVDRLVSDAKLPIIYVSHARDEVMRLARQVVLLDEGKVTAVGAPDDLLPVKPDLSRAVLVAKSAQHSARTAYRVEVLAVEGPTIQIAFEGTTHRLPRGDFTARPGQIVTLLLP